MKAHWFSLTLLSLQLLPLACFAERPSSGERSSHAEHTGVYERFNSERKTLLAQSYTPGQPIKLHDYSSHSSQSTQSIPTSEPPPFSGNGSGQGFPSSPLSPFSSGASGGNKDRLPDLIPQMNVTQPAESSTGTTNTSAPSTSAAPNFWTTPSNTSIPNSSTGSSTVSIPNFSVTPGTSTTPNYSNASSTPGTSNFSIAPSNSLMPSYSATPSSSSAPNVPTTPATTGATTSSASADITPTDKKKERPAKVHNGPGLSSRLKHFAGDVIKVAPDVLTGASQGYSNGAGTPYQQGNTSGGTPGRESSGGGANYGGPSAAAKQQGLVQSANRAIREEQAGDYWSAGETFWGICDSAIGGLGYKERTDMWEHGHIGQYTCADLYKHALNCHAIVYRGFLDEGKQPDGMNMEENEYAMTIFKDCTCIQLCDPQDASSYYLMALNDIAVDKQELAHARAFWQLGLCEHCKNCTPELKTKCEVLRDHIRLAGVLELADENRAKFANMAAFVWGHEHPTVNIYTDASGNVTHVVGGNSGPMTYYYPLMKEMLKNDYPKFQANYERLVAYIHSLPNPAVAIPPGDGTPDIARWKIRQNEIKSYGPVVYRTNGHF